MHCSRDAPDGCANRMTPDERRPERGAGRWPQRKSGRTPGRRHERRPGRRALAVLVLLVLAALWGQPASAGDRSGSVLFSWALVCQSEAGVGKAVNYQKNVIRLEAGDRFKIHLQPSKSCYIYLYLHDAQKNLFLVFPDDFEHFDQGSRITRNYELPGVNSWFYLDEAGGVELFYLIASSRRLEELERSTQRYLEGSRAQMDDLKAVAVKHEVLDEIRRLIKETSYLSDASEKPVAVAGDFRGIREEHGLNGVRIETTEIYVKTIRLQH